MLTRFPFLSKRFTQSIKDASRHASFLSSKSQTFIKKALRKEADAYKSFASLYKGKSKSALAEMTQWMHKDSDTTFNTPQLGDICGEYEYFFDSLPSQACEDLYRRPVKSLLPSDTSLILDVNQLARYFRIPIAVHQVRPLLNGTYIAVSIEDSSSGAIRLLCKHVASNIVYEMELPICIKDFDVAVSDSKIILVLLAAKDGFRTSQVYTTYVPLCDIAHAPAKHAQLVKHMSPPSPITLLFQEDDPQYFVDLNRSKDERFVLIHSHSKVGSAVYAIDVSDHASLLCLVPKSPNVKYFVTSDTKNFYVTTNFSNPSGDMCVMYQPISATCDLQWKHFWPLHEQCHRYVCDMEVLHDYVIVLSRYCTEIYIDIIRADDHSLVKQISANDIADVVGTKPFNFYLLGNYGSGIDTVRVQLSSPALKEACIEICCKSGNILRHFATSVLNPNSKLSIINTLVSSHDEYKVPLSLLRREEVKTPSPVLLVGYGSYGMSVPMEYDNLIAYLLQDGWTIAYAHTRGGGELGVQHHRGGMKDKKWNTFHDFIACAKYLHENNIASPRGLCGLGHSAGGLTVGVASNMCPELFAAIVMRAPFVNIYDAMQDHNAPLTQHEYDEWGDLKDPAMLEYIKSYCPYNNLKLQKYPAMHISIGLRDDRVTPGDVIRYAARVRDCYEGNIVLLTIQESADHYGPGTQVGQVEAAAKEAAFLDYIVHDVIR